MQAGQVGGVDQGAENGIDTRVSSPIICQLCYEIFALDPEDCPLSERCRNQMPALERTDALLEGFQHIGFLPGYDIADEFRSKASKLKSCVRKARAQPPSLWRHPNNQSIDLRSRGSSS